MLILASASPRRHELLLAAGLDHLVQPTLVPENRRPGESPAAFVRRLAEEKARAAVRSPEDIVLAADTVVCVENELFGKPSSDDDARRMLRLLSGRDHWVHTGICLLASSACIVDLASTKVAFLPLREQEIEEYIRTGEPQDKAGAYAIQGRASKFVASIEGSYHNVVGLPVSLVYTHLKTLWTACIPSITPPETGTNPSD